MKVVVPAGIGDFSWLWSKLCHVGDQIEEFIVVDGWPYRTTPYVELCGKKASYGDFTYTQILVDKRLNGWSTWSEIRESGREMVLLECNEHLESGKKLSQWLPDLPTSFHYPLQVSDQVHSKAEKLLKDLPRPLVGISCASYRGSEAWKTWGRKEWKVFLGKVMGLGWQPVMLGGFWDDLTFALASELGLPDLVGKTSVEEAVAVQTLLDSYIGFSSGLGIVRTVLDLPVMMLWPDHQVPLSTSWAPPKMLEEGRYLACRWLPVEDVWTWTRGFLSLCKEEVYGYSSKERGIKTESEKNPPPWQGEGQEVDQKAGEVFRG